MRTEKWDAPTAKGTARRRLWKRSLPRRERKERRRTTATAVQSQTRPPGSGLNVLEPDNVLVAVAIQHSRRVTGRWGPNRLGRHILERERGKSLRLGDRAGTGLCGSEMRRPSRSGRLHVAQHQPDGVRLLPVRTRGLRQTFGRLSVIGPRGL